MSDCIAVAPSAEQYSGEVPSWPQGQETPSPRLASQSAQNRFTDALAALTVAVERSLSEAEVRGR